VTTVLRSQWGSVTTVLPSQWGSVTTVLPSQWGSMTTVLPSHAPHMPMYLEVRYQLGQRLVVEAVVAVGEHDVNRAGRCPAHTARTACAASGKAPS
jgi:hypothetical protein